MRRVPPIAATWISFRATCATGDLHLDVPSGGVSHPNAGLYLNVPPGAHTWISYWTVPHKFTYCALVHQCRPINQSALGLSPGGKKRNFQRRRERVNSQYRRKLDAIPDIRLCLVSLELIL
ncbi:hypothetical protein AVEN_19921-1 [Araneus ventricosus]|uniref:Uncharacterized protein n=1 Tax=Araneus ventricosus TaxID=182803 RepID=A0A4Y2X1T8_ARAVE|nr:hypothetical protein AVEN_19921-1 [Araneus ventricosus]